MLQTSLQRSTGVASVVFAKLAKTARVARVAVGDSSAVPALIFYDNMLHALAAALAFQAPEAPAVDRDSDR
tara:strand:- start:908 stop:1120 length:213 start_codon:yes stop_codon:yes gene_type:complete